MCRHRQQQQQQQQPRQTKRQAHKIHNWLVHSLCACVCEALWLWPDKLLLCLGCSCSCSSFDWQHLLTNLFACCTFRAAAASGIVRCIVFVWHCCKWRGHSQSRCRCRCRRRRRRWRWFDTQATPLPVTGAGGGGKGNGRLACGQRLATCLVGNATRLKNNQF